MQELRHFRHTGQGDSDCQEHGVKWLWFYDTLFLTEGAFHGALRMNSRLLVVFSLVAHVSLSAASAHAQDVVARNDSDHSLGLPAVLSPFVSIRPKPRLHVEGGSIGMPPSDTVGEAELAFRPQTWPEPRGRRPSAPLPGFLIGVFR